jgi:hypothetical protein
MQLAAAQKATRVSVRAAISNTQLVSATVRPHQPLTQYRMRNATSAATQETQIASRM